MIGYEDIGGNLLDFNFLNNPTYKITVYKPMHYKIQVELDKSAYVMLYLVKSNVQNQQNQNLDEDCTNLPLSAFVNSNNPGFYFQGISHLKAELEQGDYYLIVSI
jgi:hypothetical protein